MVAGIFEKSKRFRLAVFCCAMYKAPQSVLAGPAHAGPCKPIMRKYDVLSHGKQVEAEEEFATRFASKKTSAPAGTDLPASAARCVVQSHDHSVREFGIGCAAMFLASRASIFRPCPQPAEPFAPELTRFRLDLPPATHLFDVRIHLWIRSQRCPGILAVPAEGAAVLPRLHRASPRPLQREEERSRRLVLRGRQQP